MRIRGVSAFVGVLVLALQPGGAAAVGWRQTFEEGWGRSVLLDAGGDVFVGGRTDLAGFEKALIVLRLEGASGAEVWRREIDGTDTTDCCSDGTEDTVVALTQMPGGDVVAAGLLDNTGTQDDFTVIRLDDTTGAEIWRQELNGAGSSDDAASAVSVDSMGDVYAAGGLLVGTSINFTVVKLAGATGAEAWRYQIVGRALAVAVDAAGDVVAAGFGPTGLFTVVKLSGTTGAELWNQQLATSGSAMAVAVDGAGDVIAAGEGDGFTVVKLAGGTGTELWRQDLGGQNGAARSVVIDPMNDVLVGGSVGNVPTDSLILKLAGATGDEIWRQSLPGGPLNSVVNGVALDAAGNVLGGGEAGGRQLALKLDADDGTQAWLQVVDGHHYGFAAAPNGDVVNAGIGPNPDLLYTFRFASLDGSLGSVGGRSLSVIDAGGPRDPRVRLVAKDDGVALPPPGSAGDPTINGATIRLVNPTTLETATLALPAGSSWIVAGDPAAPRAYVYRDRLGVYGPCSHVLVKRGRNIGVVCSGNLGPIPFTLDEASQGTLAVTVQLGSAQPQCAVFGGDVSRDQPGFFRARKAPAIAGVCP